MEDGDGANTITVIDSFEVQQILLGPVLVEYNEE